MNELGEIPENIAIVPNIPVPESAPQEIICKQLLTLETQIFKLGAEKMAEEEVEEGECSLDRPVRVIHMICLLHHSIFTRIK